MGQLKMKPQEMTRTEALLHVMNFCRAGALVQAVIMDALGKGYPDAARAVVYRTGDTNEDVVRRLLAADAMLGRSDTLDVVKAYADEVVKLGREDVARQFEQSGAARMIHPAAWSTACEDIAHAMGVALPDPAPAGKSKAADVELRIVFRDARGIVVESAQGRAAEMIERATAFMVAHGTDPDGDGEEAQAGRISFEPI